MAQKRKAKSRDSSEVQKVIINNGNSDSEIELNGELSDSDLDSDIDTEDEQSADANETEDDNEADTDDIEEDSLEDDNDSNNLTEDEAEALLMRKERIDWGGLTTGSHQDSPGLDGEDSEDEQPNYEMTTDANGNLRYIYKEIDPVYDSDDSDAPITKNTIGDIPLSFYDLYPHIGYDINGKKIGRPEKGDALETMLNSIEIPKGWTGLMDPATGKPLELSQDQLQLLKQIQFDEIPGDGYDPYEPTVEWFTSKLEQMPLSAAPEPKRRFVKSRAERKLIMKIVKGIKEGRIKPYKEPTEEELEEDSIPKHDLWASEAPRPDHIMNIPALKLQPPPHEASYHPPPEYLPNEKETKEWEEMDEEDRKVPFLPQDHDSLRKVGAYANFVKDRFERCLDLYLAPRVRRSKLDMDPEDLLPKLPSAEELKPFPSVASTTFRGHKGQIRSVDIDPSGQWIATGGQDGTVRVFELTSGHPAWAVKLGADEAVNVVRWRPGRDALILVAGHAETLYTMIPPLCSPEIETASNALLDAGWGYSTTNTTSTTAKKPQHTWTRPSSAFVQKQVCTQVTLRSTIKSISWHRRGNYLVTVSPTGQSSSVAIHQLSKHLTQLPFPRLKGLAQTASFHPSKPQLFIATQRTIRIYDLAQQQLLKTLQPGARWISSISVHPGGDNVLASSYDRRLLWHDLQLSTKPYKTLRYHDKAIRSVAFHPGGYPLFVDASDDGTLQVFHGGVVADLSRNAEIVPLKVLRGHKVTNALGVLEVAWDGGRPWCVSVGADGLGKLWV